MSQELSHGSRNIYEQNEMRQPSLKYYLRNFANAYSQLLFNFKVISGYKILLNGKYS